jgi:hypothetical protein
MKAETKEDISIITLGVLILCTGFLIGILCGIDIGYKEGQTDAINGKWKYEKHIVIDSTYIQIK